MELLSTLWAYAVLLYHFVSTNPAGVGAAVGAVTPVIVSVLSQPRFTKRTRVLLAMGTSVVIGAAVALSTSVINGPGDFILMLFTLYTTCEATYQRIYKESGLAALVEAVTSPKPKPDEPVTEADPYEGELVD